jgi:hypothetical protein
MTSRRLSALVLLLALVAGGFGMPVADAVLYHSTPASPPAHQADDIAFGTPTSSTHLQGCVLWLSALTGSGISGEGPTLSAGRATSNDIRFTHPQVVVLQSDLALGQPRAPPIA